MKISFYYQCPDCTWPGLQARNSETWKSFIASPSASLDTEWNSRPFGISNAVCRGWGPWVNTSHSTEEFTLGWAVWLALWLVCHFSRQSSMSCDGLLWGLKDYSGKDLIRNRRFHEPWHTKYVKLLGSGLRLAMFTIYIATFTDVTFAMQITLWCPAVHRVKIAAPVLQGSPEPMLSTWLNF